MKTNLICVFAGALIGATLIWVFYPRVESKVEYKDRTKVETRIVTRIKEVRGKDGTSTTETEIVDVGHRTEDTSLMVLKAAQKQYVVGVGVGYDWGHFEQPDYSVTLGRRVLGPLLGAITVSKERAQVAVLFEF